MDLNRNAYTLEFFKFTPEQVAAERDHLVESLITRAIETTVKKIETPATAALLAEQKDAVKGLMLKACLPKLDALRQLDKQTFDVPEHVLLIKDFELEQQVSAEEEQAKEAELEQLKRRYRENMAMLAELNAEQENYQAIEPLIQQELQMQQRIYEACANSEFKNIHAFASSLAGIEAGEKP
ncbi:hypothetical protein KR222_009813 [Zaprionus bogoriensis]|nr:hypothetical protein KR222_009813 [Zaprionus bogoriensis]